MMMMFRMSLLFLAGMVLAEDSEQEDLAPKRPALLRRVAIDRAGKLGLDEDVEEEAYPEDENSIRRVTIDKSGVDEVEFYQRSPSEAEMLEGEAEDSDIAVRRKEHQQQQDQVMKQTISSQLPVPVLVPTGSCQTVTCSPGSSCGCPSGSNTVISSIMESSSNAVASILCCPQVISFPTLSQIGYQVPTLQQVQAASASSTATATAGASAGASASTGSSATVGLAAPTATGATTAATNSSSSTNSSNSSNSSNVTTAQKGAACYQASHVLSATLLALASLALRSM